MIDDIHNFIAQMHNGVQYGSIQFTVKKHDGLVASIDANKTSWFKIKDNVQALTMIGSLIKAVQQQVLEETKVKDDHYTPPNLSFTVFYNKSGQVDRIHVNDFKRKTF